MHGKAPEGQKGGWAATVEPTNRGQGGEGQSDHTDFTLARALFGDMLQNEDAKSHAKHEVVLQLLEKLTQKTADLEAHVLMSQQRKDSSTEGYITRVAEMLQDVARGVRMLLQQPSLQIEHIRQGLRDDTAETEKRFVSAVEEVVVATGEKSIGAIHTVLETLAPRIGSMARGDDMRTMFDAIIASQQGLLEHLQQLASTVSPSHIGVQDMSRRLDALTARLEQQQSSSVILDEAQLTLLRDGLTSIARTQDVIHGALESTQDVARVLGNKLDALGGIFADEFRLTHTGTSELRHQVAGVEVAVDKVGKAVADLSIQTDARSERVAELEDKIRELRQIIDLYEANDDLKKITVDSDADRVAVLQTQVMRLEKELAETKKHLQDESSLRRTHTEVVYAEAGVTHARIHVENAEHAVREEIGRMLADFKKVGFTSALPLTSLEECEAVIRIFNEFAQQRIAEKYPNASIQISEREAAQQAIQDLVVYERQNIKRVFVSLEGARTQFSDLVHLAR